MKMMLDTFIIPLRQVEVDILTKNQKLLLDSDFKITTLMWQMSDSNDVSVQDIMYSMSYTI